MLNITNNSLKSILVVEYGEIRNGKMLDHLRPPSITLHLLKQKLIEFLRAICKKWLVEVLMEIIWKLRLSAKLFKST